jgi:hypothetical protein
MCTYKRLYEAYQGGQGGFIFSVADYRFQGFNEQQVKNEFVPGLKVTDNE